MLAYVAKGCVFGSTDKKKQIIGEQGRWEQLHGGFSIRCWCSNSLMTG